jgi:type VI protein secretion system component VasK
VERDPAVKLWMLRMADLVLKPAHQRMEDSLRARVAGAPGNFLDDFYRFRAWRLLGEPRQIDVEDARILTREVSKALADRLELGGADQAQRAQYPELVARQMEFLARNPRDLAAVVRSSIPEPDRTLIPAVAAVVRSEWRPEAFYQELVAESGARAKPLEFGTLAGATSLMAGSVAVPGAFTAAGWSDEVKPRAAWYGRLGRRDALLAEMFGGRTPELERDVLGYYAPDVTRHWVAFLDGVEYARQSSVGGAADLLARLAQGDSPLFKMLRGVNEQTKGIAAPGTPVESVARDFQPLAEFFAPPGSLGERTKTFLADLPRLIPGRAKRPATSRQSLDAQYLEVLAKAQADVKGLGGGASLTDFQSLLSPPPDQTNGVFELVSFADGLGATYDDTPVGAALARVLRDPAAVVGEIVRTRGLGPRVAAAWQSLFLGRFQSTLGNAYPFASGGADASPDEVAACFGPTGYFWTFYAQHLAPFLNEDGSPKTADAPPVSGAMVEFLRKAYAIRKALFAAGPTPAIAFTVSTTPPEHDRGVILVRWIAFDCGGQNVTYTMGPPSDEPLRWPGPDVLGPSGLRAQAAPPEDPKKKKRKKGEPESIAVEPLSASGYWGLFRLIDRAAAVSSAGGVTRATWNLSAANGARIRTTWELKVTSGESPFARGFLRMSPPATP